MGRPPVDVPEASVRTRALGVEEQPNSLTASAIIEAPAESHTKSPVKASEPGPSEGSSTRSDVTNTYNNGSERNSFDEAQAQAQVFEEPEKATETVPALELLNSRPEQTTAEDLGSDQALSSVEQLEIGPDSGRGNVQEKDLAHGHAGADIELSRLSASSDDSTATPENQVAASSDLAAVPEDNNNTSSSLDTSEDPFAVAELQETLKAAGIKARNKHGKVFAVVNQKGGVGKSTTAVNLSAALAEAGKTVLMIDIDPQGNATSGLGFNRGDSQIHHEYCIYDVIINNTPIGNVIKATGQKNLFILPATIDLAGAEIELVPMMARETRLKNVIGPIREYFDLIVIDCPPSIGLLTVNALAAADELIIPIQCEYFALEGLSRLVSSIDLVKNSLNPNLTIGGVLMTMQDNRLKLSSEVIDEVRSHFKEKVFNAVIPRNVRLSEAPSHGLPINAYDGGSVGAKAYKDLAQEVISRG